jgi:hypothetical protein
MALAAGTLGQRDVNIFCNLLPHPSCRISPHSWITSSHSKGWVGYISHLPIAWQEVGRVLCSAVKWWQIVYSYLDLFEGSNHWMWLSVCKHKHTLSRNRQHSPSEDISWSVSLLLCSWTCSSSSLCVITVSTVQLQTVQFVQYLYSKCAVE